MGRGGEFYSKEKPKDCKMIFWVLNMKLLFIVFLISTVVFASIPSSPKNIDDSVPLLPVKQAIIPQKLDASDSDSGDLVDGCRDMSLHKCGSSMVRVFRLLDYLPWQKSYNAKCSLRKAFFTCMKTEDRPCKKRRWRTSDSRFRKKLARSLWSTRGCVLGALPNGTHV